MLRFPRLVLLFLSCALSLTAMAQSANLAVTKQGPSSFARGSDITYTIGVTNGGPDAASNVVLTDNVPAGMTFVSITPNAGCTTPAVGGTGTITCTTATLAAGGSLSYQLVFNLPPTAEPGTYINTATVGSDTPDPDSSNNSADSMGITAADLAVTKDGPSTLTPGANATYTITVLNSGVDTADNVVMNDNLPPGMTFVSVSPSANCSTPAVGDSGSVTCMTASLAPNASVVYTLVVMVPGQAAPGTVFTNIATATADNPDPNEENNEGVTAGSTPPPPTADLALQKLSPSLAAADSDVTYTITLTNGGPDDGQNVTLDDTLPGTMTFVSESHPVGFNCTSPAVGAGGTISCAAQIPLPPGNYNFTIVGHIPPGTPSGTTYDNTVTTKADNDPNPDNNTAVAETTVTATNASVVKSGPPAANAGMDIDYVITIGNSGFPADIVMTDPLPAGTTFVSVQQNSGQPASCSNPPIGQNGTVSCGVSLLNNQTSQVTIRVHINGGFSGLLSNTATVTTPADTDNSNNSSNVTTTVTTLADLGVTKSGPATTTAGTTVDYTVTVVNNGPSDAQNVSLTETLPAGATFVGVTQTSGPTFSCNGIGTCTIGTFASGATATFTYTLRSGAATASGTTLTNSVTVASTTTDPNPANNTASSAPATVATSADLSIVKTVPGAVIAGNDMTYSLAFANAGPSDAQNVTISDTLPANTTFVSVNGVGATCTPLAVGGTGTVTCTRTTLPASANGSVTLIVHVASNTPAGSISNTATIATTTPDPNATNNSSTGSTNVTTNADVRVVKTGPATAQPASDVTYTIAVANAGPSDAQNVTVTDTIPASTTFVSITAAGYTCTTPAVGSTGLVSCSRPLLAAGTNAPITLVAHTTSSALGNIPNTANVASGTPDANVTNNSSTATVAVGALADVAVTKTAVTPANVTQIAFDVTVTNNGPGDAATVTMTDAVPAGTTFVSATQTAGPAFVCTTPAAGATSGTISCSIGTLVAGGTATFNLVFAPASINALPISNTANVTTASPDPNAANNTANASSFPPGAVPAATPIVLALLALTLVGIALTVLRH